MADAEDMENEEGTEVTEVEEDNEGEEATPVEEDAEAGEENVDGEEQEEGDQPENEEGGEGDENDEAAENVDDETAEVPETEEPVVEAVPDDVELEIRDEDEGRPVSSLSKKSVSFAPEPPTPAKAPGQNVIVKMIRGMWASREMLNESSDMQIVMKTTLRELIVYCVFLFVIVYMTFAPYSADYYVLRKGIGREGLFEDQLKIRKNMDFWHFAETELLDGLYWEELYNKGRRVTTFKCPITEQLANGPCPVPYTDRNMMYENRMLGVPRMRQLKVTNTSCLDTLNPDFSSAIRKCYSPYSEEDEDTARYTPEHRKFTDDSAWTYQTAEELETGSYDGELATYSGGGYVQNLHFQKNITEAMLAELKKNLWIDRGTRFLSIDFTVYNGNINLFAVVKLCFEFPATGGIRPASDIQIIKLLKYAEYKDFLLLASELIFIVFILYYCVEELFEIHEHGWAYFSVFGNVLDIVVIGTSIAQIMINWSMLYLVNLKLGALMNVPFQYADFTSLSSNAKWANYLAAFNIFVAWLKVFKYLSFNKTMNQLSGTLSKCSKELGGFTVMFAIIFFAFAELGYLLFGVQVADYKSTKEATFTLFRTILGDFNFVAIEQADYIWGPIFFLSYIFFVFFVLLNMFLAIINDTYGEVKADLKRAKPSFQLGDFFMVGVNNVKAASGIHDRKLDVENAVKIAAEDDGFVTYSELRENLKHSNFSDVEIDLYFDMFSDDPAMADMIRNDEDHKEQQLEEERLAQLENMLDEEDLSDSDESGSASHSFSSRPMSGKEARQARSARIRAALAGKQPLEANRFYGLTDRMSRMEATIGPIVTKLDSILNKIDDAKRIKMKKKETMQRLIENIEDDDQMDEAQKTTQIREIASRMDFI